jgi:hypothetical protein
MSSSSRSIAAARQKRAGEQAPQMNNSRPVTSISSQGAFAQQQQYQQQQMMNQNIPVGSKNVRVAQNRSQTVGSGGRMNNQTNQSQPDQTTKISVSDAIGLITLRLGRLENIVNDAIEDGSINNTNGLDSTGNSVIPSNMKLVSDEVFENIVNRINLLESKVINFTNQNENFVKEISGIQYSINNFNETLSSFMNEMNDKFIDYENALGEIEKNIEINDATNMVTSEKSEIFLPPHNENNESLASNETEENEETEQDH